MIYRFGTCELRVGSHELIVDGVPIPVEPMTFDLLRVLASRPGELLSRDCLIAEVWRGRIVSDAAVASQIAAARAAIGDDGARQALIRTVPRRGIRFLPEVTATAEGEAPAPGPDLGPDRAPCTGPESGPMRQVVRFCRSADGTAIAHAAFGSGPHLVRAGHWLTHLEHDWQSPLWRPFLDALGARFTVTRYDQRGNGLSDWDAADFTLDRCVEDLEAVVDAQGLDRFVLYGTSQGAPIAAAYAARHPDRVSRLVLHGGYRRGRLVRANAEERAQGEALLTLIRHGWGKSGSSFIQAFASMFIPGGSREQVLSLTDLQRRTTSPENAARLREAIDRFDVTGALGTISVPTLVMHARDDSVQPLEQGRKLAASIPNARFQMLESENHVVLPQEPAWEAFFTALARFAEE
ncbi:alpha/beta fold hydrolase [Futiania mangrovi]|uniref:Alpha/beta hydrolase n=1 Tax=Futiania mangrovi TaxID=2959716 RepID=A0A9J6PD15_9PROT|nr:alpha/beta fold hydrolase [Futiania mangrovii]MCP1335563.1 alpha/beta hydrolase [Futiania mangrovii]